MTKIYLVYYRDGVTEADLIKIFKTKEGAEHFVQQHDLFTVPYLYVEETEIYP